MSDQTSSPSKKKKQKHIFSVALPEMGFLRLPQIIGDPSANPPIPALVPVGKSSWWAGVKSGRYPAKHRLGPRTTAWRVEDIRTLIESSSGVRS